MDTCPLNRQKCESEETCPFTISLEDYQGCPFDLAGKAIQDLKLNTLLPAALKLDGMVRKLFTPKN